MSTQATEVSEMYKSQNSLALHLKCGDITISACDEHVDMCTSAATWARVINSIRSMKDTSGDGYSCFWKFEENSVLYSGFLFVNGCEDKRKKGMLMKELHAVGASDITFLVQADDTQRADMFAN